LKPDVHPEHASETFDQLVKFFEKFDRSEELGKRISGMDQVQKKFKRKYSNLQIALALKETGRKQVRLPLNSIEA